MSERFQQGPPAASPSTGTTGEVMRDGTVYAGISPNTGKPLYAAPMDAPLMMRWQRAMEYAATLDAHGHNDWRLPARSELEMLSRNRSLVGGFNESASGAAAVYWSSTENPAFDDAAWSLRFCEGHHGYGHLKRFEASVRLVRG